MWTGRLMLESCLHESSLFVTLTYDEEHLPNDRCVSVREFQLFIKRLRFHCGECQVRYYGCGEYGDKTERPHYHVALFGVRDKDCVVASWRDSAGKAIGFVHIGELTPESASYLCSYVVKRQTSFGALGLKGRAPEFARMSKKPGIGYGAALEIGSALVSKSGARGVAAEGDVVRRFRSRNRSWPLGRYLVCAIRDAVGVSEDHIRLRYEAVLRELQEQGWEGRRVRDVAREGAANRAARLSEISNSRKGIGL